jgi:hypothetical protein
MPLLPAYITILFFFTTLLTFIGCLWIIRLSATPATRRKLYKIALGLWVWITVQAILAMKGIYHAHPQAMPPKIVLLGIVPALLVIVLLFASRAGRQFLDGLPLQQITYLHTIRIPVEICLYALFLHKTVPQGMTFEGRNFDIIAGITAPVMAYLYFRRKQFSPRVLLWWNLICLVSLFNIVINALLSTPSPMQRFAFDQPNIAVLYFPFSWLPVFIVPTVLLAHLVAIRQLLKRPGS